MAKVVLANDHGAVELAGAVKRHLEEKGYEVVWLGVETADPVDYPDMAEAAVREFRKGGFEFGVVCCGTGIGISISANKMEGIRCALPQNVYAARMAREHNNANFIAFGGRIEYPCPVAAMLDAFAGAEFQGGRHERRVGKIMALQGR